MIRYLYRGDGFIEATKEMLYLYPCIHLHADGWLCLDAQKDKLRKYAEYEDIAIVGEYSDYGVNLICVEDGELLIAENEVEVIRAIYDRYIHTNDGISGVAKYLNRQGFKKKLRQDKISGGNIYQLLLAFDQVYGFASEVERKEFMRTFIERIEIYPEKPENGC